MASKEVRNDIVYHLQWGRGASDYVRHFGRHVAGDTYLPQMLSYRIVQLRVYLVCYLLNSASSKSLISPSSRSCLIFNIIIAISETGKCVFAIPKKEILYIKKARIAVGCFQVPQKSSRRFFGR